MSQDFSTFKTCAIAIPDSQKTSAPSVEAGVGGIGGTPFTTVSRAVLTKLDQLWSNGQSISYSFFGGTHSQQKKVDTVIPEWSQYANITFERVSDEAADATVRISFDPQLGSWSYVGTTVRTIASPRVTMNLGWVVDNDDLAPDEHGVILHEWGHTLGLMHELQSPARGGKIHLNEDEVYAYYMATQKWDRATVKSQIIDVYDSTAVSNYSELDVTSVMMYFMPAAMNLEHTDVPVNNQLSQLDKAYMVINYPRPQPSPLAPQWTLDFALKIAGVDATTAAAIKNAPDVDTARMDFTAYVVAQRRKSVANAVKTPGSPQTSPSGNDPAHGTTVAPSGTTRDTWCGAKLLKAPTPTGPSDVQHGLVRPGVFWPSNSTVKYGFLQTNDPEQATAYRRQRVRDILDFYERFTSLKFELVDIRGWNFELSPNRALCPVRITFGPPVTQKDGSITHGWSYTGSSALDSAYDPAVETDGGEKWTTTYLGSQPAASWSTDVDISRADRTLYHELGHLMGLSHEHASPNSPVGVPGNVADYLVSTLFDAQSVMLYADIPYNNEPDRLTILNIVPSLTDKYLLSLLYPDSGDANSKFAFALSVFGFTTTKKQTLLANAKKALATGADPTLLRDLRDAIAFDIANNPRLAETPSHGIEQPQSDAAPGPVAGTKMPGFLMELVDALKQFFNPGGNQIFTLQFPGRFLQQTDYAWDTATAGFYGQFVKPVAVNEAEFRLVDQLYDLTDRVGGSNGLNLSIVYEQLLNNLLPKYVDNGLAKQQDQIRQWLLKDVPTSQWIKDIMSRQKQRETALAQAFAKSMGTVPAAATTTQDPAAASSSDLTPGIMHDISSKSIDKGEALNRIELGELLMNEYLYAKQDWEEERDALIRQASLPKLGTPESQQALNDLTRKLAHITATRQAQLAAKYSDAVVRGYSHTVRDYLGYLDIASPAEALQNAKDSLREAAASSLDGALKVYPVQLTPLDWFDGLSTSFNLEDLTADPEVIRTQINAKSQQLDTLNSQLISLQLDATGDPAALQQKVAAAQTELDSAQSTLAETYSNNVISLARTYLDATGTVDQDALSKKTGVKKELLAQLPDQMEKVRVAQDKLTASSRALSQLLAAHALAQATDTQQQQQQLQLQIKSITKDLTELQTRWQILTASSGGVTPPKITDQDVKLDPTQPVALPADRSSGGSRWQTITLQSSKASRTATTSASSTASSEQWSCNFWLASGGGSSSSSSAASAAATTASEDTIDVAFRATLVTVDRGGWFQPQFFKESKAFYKVNNEISWVDGDRGVKGLLPGFPVSFLIVKDVVIRVTHSTTSTSDTKSFDQSSSASSGGCLCFSYSRSSSSSDSATSSSFQAFSNGFVVKIPGPQLLGYMIQKTDADEALLMPPTLPPNFFIPDDQYNSALKAVDPNSSNAAKPGQTSAATPAPANAATPAPPDSPNPAHGAAPAAGGSSPAKPVIAVDKVREIVGHIVEERLDDLFAKISAQT